MNDEKIIVFPSKKRASEVNDPDDVFYFRAWEELKNGYIEDRLLKIIEDSAEDDDEIINFYISMRVQQMKKHSYVFPANYLAVNEEFPVTAIKQFWNELLNDASPLELVITIASWLYLLHVVWQIFID